MERRKWKSAMMRMILIVITKTTRTDIPTLLL
jgi:hypothetical protein